jgi:hypothetical protein
LSWIWEVAKVVRRGELNAYININVLYNIQKVIKIKPKFIPQETGKKREESTPKRRKEILRSENQLKTESTEKTNLKI